MVKTTSLKTDLFYMKKSNSGMTKVGLKLTENP